MTSGSRSTATTTTASVPGCGCLGSILAMVLSAAFGNGLGWLILHGLISWFYVLYALLFRSKEIVPALRVMFGV